MSGPTIKENKVKELPFKNMMSRDEKDDTKANKNLNLNGKTREKYSLLQSLVNSYEKYNAVSVLVAIVSVLIILIIYGDECRKCFSAIEKKTITPEFEYHKTFWVFGRNVESGYLQNVFYVLESLGYKNDPNAKDWDLLWSHDYPFRMLNTQLSHLKPYQKVNHFPGCGYITNKVDLATSWLKFIPPAFKLPIDKDKLLKYAVENPNVSFVQKNNDHRNIRVQKIDQITLESEGTFIQQFVEQPLLVNGHKFDIGIYSVITSIDPLRIYIYNGDALLRFCTTKYYPFDPSNLDKYVVGDDYLPVWKVPALSYYYNELGFGMRDSLNCFLKSIGKNPKVIWEQIEDAIRTIILAKEPLILDVVNRFGKKRNFFEMMRFDFVVDENLKIYLLEANMSPNLSSAHFPPNQLLYNQVLYNILGLVGVGEMIWKNTLAYRSKLEKEMVVSDKNLATFPEKCNSPMCQTSCMSPDCQLCKSCLSAEAREYLSEAFMEHLRKGDCKRIFPASMGREKALLNIDLDKYSAENQLQYKWFQGKCQLDSSWC